MSLFKTFTVNIHCPGTVVEDCEMEVLNEALESIPIAGILKDILERKFQDNKTLQVMTVTIHED